MKPETQSSNPEPRTITIFGSSQTLPNEPLYQSTYQLGKLLARDNYIICNGGYGGIMEASARGAKEAGGKTIGVVTEQFSIEANAYIIQKIVVKTLIDRLLKLIELGDAYVVLKGSTGTLLELAAVWEQMNKRLLRHKPIIVLGDFWSPVVQTLKDELSHEGLTNATSYVQLVRTPEECLTLLNKSLQTA
ncbi:MAG: LOG family protein [Ignavibacteriae bacterium]|nr:LOG family protein [Ignavibacteriota bacterium]